MVGEAGWTSERDHVWIAWALRNSWKQRIERYPMLRFVDHVKSYCASIGGGAATARQRWVRALPAPGRDGVAPTGWPRNLDWQAHRPLWREVVRLSTEWGLGQHRDPSAGRVLHFGARHQSLPDIHRARRAVRDGRWCRLRSGDTRNAFYGRCS